MPETLSGSLSYNVAQKSDKWNIHFCGLTHSEFTRKQQDWPNMVGVLPVII